MSDKDKRLLYSLIEKLLYIREITTPEVHDCVLYIITRMESPTICQENRHFKIDVLLVKKIQLFVLSSTEDRCTHLELLFSKYANYVLKVTQQIIQSRRFKKVSIVMKRVLKNMIKWFDSNPHVILTKYITDHKEHTNNDTDKERYKMI